MKAFKTIVLAAGKGVRMKSDTPKVLHPVCGRLMIDYITDIAKSLGSLKICVVVGHKSELVQKHLGNRVAIVIQKRLLGTADAVKSAKRYLSAGAGDTLILSGDTPLLKLETIKGLLKKHQTSNAAATVLTAHVDNAKGYGRIIREGNSVVAIREELDASEEEKEISEINVGAYVFKTKGLLNAIGAVKLNARKKEFYLTDTISVLAQKGAVVETATTDDFKEGLGINTREDLAFAESVIRKRVLKKLMSEGVTIVDPETTYIADGVKIGQDTVVFPCTVIEEDVFIGKKCAIGPFSRIRAHSRIGNYAEVRNFAEVSRSKLGDHSFMKHFSFLGDAVAGKNVNIGAGVVTANFDGKNKNKTSISDGAFIGSDSILVAPVTIGKKAVTAAGCVVTKGTKVPDHGIVVGVPARLRPRRK